jgi:hypothetical protein
MQLRQTVRKKQVQSALLAAAVASLSLTWPARAADVIWTGASSEFWTFGGNWFSLSQPTTTDSAVFSDDAPFIVIRTNVILSADRTINFFTVEGDHFMEGPYSFSRIDGARLTAFGGTTLGTVGATTSSTTTLNGWLMQTNTLRVRGLTTAVITGNANITTTGEMSLDNSAVLNLNGGSLGLAGGANHDIFSGTMNVNGGTLNLGANAELVLSSPTSKLNFSSGFNILNNARISANFGADVVGTSFIDVGNGGVGRLTVAGAGSTFTAQSSTSDWGRGAAGNATVDILLGGTATVAFLRVGTVDAQATLNVNGGTLVVNSDFEAGGGTTLRTVQMTLQNSGTMTVNGATTFNNQADLDFSSGTLNFNQNVTINEGARIDRSGGTMNIASLKKLIVNGGVYNDTRTSGQTLSNGAGIEVRGGSARFNVSQFFDIALGSLLVEQSGQYNSPATAATTDWAQSVNTSMTATVRSSGQINMGALRIAQNGAATVNVQSNGRLETNALTVGGSSTSAAQITLNGGFLTVFGTANLGRGARITLDDPAGSNATLGQFTRLLVDGTLNMTDDAFIVTAGQNPIVQVDALSIVSPAQVLLQPGAEMFITYGAAAAPLNTIRGYVGGFRISSTVLSSDPRLGIGYVDFPDPQFGSMTIKLTLKGDADLNSSVNFNDLVALARNFNQANRFWQQGDFDYNGMVNFNDLVALARNFNQTLNAGQIEALNGAGGGNFVEEWNRALASVPEPTTLLLGAGVGAMLLKRRRRS